MKELEYPFDASFILAKKKKLKRELLSSGREFTDKKIAVLGGSTTSEIILVMELFLLNNGIRPEFYESEYNKYYEDAVFENEELKSFSPDIVYIYTTNKNIIKYPGINDTVGEIDAQLELEIEKYKSIWAGIKEKYNCPVIQNNFEMISYRLMGNKEVSDIHGKLNFINRLNMAFYDHAEQNKDFYICDINYISADFGLKEWSDSFYYHMYKYAMNLKAIPLLSFNVANIIKSIFGKNKKGFVLDMDNTLWGGVIGDDGVDNIAIGPETANGQVYLEFQKYIKEHKDLGILLNIDSKNDIENAVAGLRHPSGELKEEDFLHIKANWEPKSENFLSIANDINVLPESLVFIDDNPAEREIVCSQIKGVSAPEIGKSHEYIHNIDRNGFFEVTNLSKDDAQRNEMYKENLERKKSEMLFNDYNEYLKSLCMVGCIRHFDEVAFSRITQLTNKTNQFNLTTKRYSQAEIESIAKDENYITLYGQLKDKFGDNGIISISIGSIKNNECHIELWLMSCRVLKRDMEYAMLDKLVEYCKELGISKIIGYYYPTKKNKMVSNLYEIFGFENISVQSDGSSVWSMDVTNEYKNKNNVIEMECN